MRLAALLIATSVSLPALDQLDLPVAGQWFTPIAERPVLRLGAAWGIEQPAAVREQDATLQRNGGYATLSGRVWKGDSTESWLRVTGVDLRLAGDATLPRGESLPDRLQDVRIGGFWRQRLADGVTYGLDAEVSSPSDVPYSGSDALAYGGTAFLRVPTTGMDAWNLLLRYDATSTLLPGVPLPGIAYQWIRPGFMATLGLPFGMVMWRPVDDWTFNAAYAPIDAGNISLAWSPGTPVAARPGQGGPWSLTAGASVSYENWFIADRANEDERLTFRTIRAYLTGGWTPLPGSSLRLTAGRILLREVYLAESWRERADNRFRVDPSWYGSVGFTTGF